MRFSRPSLTLCRLATFSVAAVAALLTTFGGLSRAVAQGPDLPEADQNALSDYKLTLDKVDKVAATAKKLVAAAKTDPQIMTEMKAIDAEKGGTFDQINATFEKKAPHVVALFRSEGLDAHDFLLGLLSTMFANVGVSLKASGSADIPKFIPAANIELAEKNAAKFESAVKDISELDSIGKE